MQWDTIFEYLFIAGYNNVAVANVLLNDELDTNVK